MQDIMSEIKDQVNNATWCKERVTDFIEAYRAKLPPYQQAYLDAYGMIDGREYCLIKNVIVLTDTGKALANVYIINSTEGCYYLYL